MRSAFSDQSMTFEYLNATNQWQTLMLPKNALAFTWCQVPIVYELTDHEFSIDVTDSDGLVVTITGQTLPGPVSDRLISRANAIIQLKVLVPHGALLS